MKDGSYQIFVVDKKSVPTNVKHMKGYETKKKGIGLKPFKEKETVALTEVHDELCLS